MINQVVCKLVAQGVVDVGTAFGEPGQAIEQTVAIVSDGRVSDKTKPIGGQLGLQLLTLAVVIIQDLPFVT